MKKRWTRLCLTLLLLLSVGTAALAAEVGSSGDPLVTLSYLNDTFLSTVLSKVDAKIAERNTALSAQIDQKIAAAGGSGASGGAADTFTVVSIPQGKTLKGDIGCEVMLRVGSASCVSPSSPGLVDETDGSVLENGGALVKNHLYMMTIENRGVKASAATVKVLVRGGYTIG